MTTATQGTMIQHNGISFQIRVYSAPSGYRFVVIGVDADYAYDSYTSYPNARTAIESATNYIAETF